MNAAGSYGECAVSDGGASASGMLTDANEATAALVPLPNPALHHVLEPLYLNSAVHAVPPSPPRHHTVHTAPTLAVTLLW